MLTVTTRARPALFLIGFFTIWGVMYAAGQFEGGVRLGLAGLAATLTVAVLWEIALLRTRPRDVLIDLGLGRPATRGIATAIIVSLLILSYFLAYPWVTGVPLPLLPDWPWLLLGVFAYHGVAEELAWRGYAFRRIRAGRSFRSAVLWTMPIIAVTHIPIIIENGPLVGSVAILVAAVTCLPFAYLWERGGRTIWAPALVHASIDAFKLFDVPSGDARITFSLGLACVSLVVPLFVFADRFVVRSAEVDCGISPV